MRARVIINPSSGIKMFQKNAEIIVRQLLSERIFDKADIIKTGKQCDAFQAALDYKDNEVDLVVAVGGDGTVNEVINGLIRGNHKTPLAILPAGTTNDFATFMNMPQSVNKFCDMIRRFNSTYIDVGKVGAQYFVNVASAGILADIPINVSTKAKTMLGQMAYYIEAAKQLTESPKLRTISVKISSKEHIIQEDILLFTISNSKSVGGFSLAAPNASVSDGLLDVLVIHKQNLLELVPLFIQIKNGTHVKNPSVSYFQTNEVIIESFNNDPVSVDIDGEKGDPLPATIQIVPHAIQLIIPPIDK